MRLASRAARAAAEEFRHLHARLLGADRVELESVRWKRSGGAWHATWHQVRHGRRVVGCLLDLTMSARGDVVAFRSTLVPDLHGRATVAGAPTAARRACEALLGRSLEIDACEPVVVAMAAAGRYEAVPALELRLGNATGGRWWALVESTRQRVLALESLLRHDILEGETSGDIRPLYALDPLQARAFPWLQLQLGALDQAARTHSDGLGRYRFSHPAATVELRAALTGLYVSVDNDAPGSPSPGFSLQVQVPGDVPVHFGADEARDDERTIYHHTNVIHDFMKDQFDFALLDFPLPAVASVVNPLNGNPDYANAFWDGGRIAFGNGGGVFMNFGLFADVIYHEYTHAITDHMYRPAGGLRGRIGGAIHEALSDYFACTITGEPLIGEFLAGGAPSLRNLDNNLQWPRDRDPTDEVHANGEILGGALWDVRLHAGPEVADAVIHFARELFPQDFEAYLDAMLIQDDLLFGDGVPGNGSPHRDAILAGFALHGMGPLGGGVLRIHHDPLRDTENAGVPQVVRASLGSVLPVAVDEMQLRYSTAGGFVVQVMQAQADGGFVGEIPGLPEGSHVEYWLRASRTRPHEVYTLPEDAPATTFGYDVGPDHTPPVVTHAASPVVPAFAWPAELTARIEDNLGVAYAWVEYTQNGVPGALLGLVRSRDDPAL
ncbi:MAG: hypothetical protein ACE5G2_12325, partial [Candidatus Krumholzibacteriia bacterium]